MYRLKQMKTKALFRSRTRQPARKWIGPFLQVMGLYWLAASIKLYMY